MPGTNQTGPTPAQETGGKIPHHEECTAVDKEFCERRCEYDTDKERCLKWLEEHAEEVYAEVARWLVENKTVLVSQDAVEDIVKEMLGETDENIDWNLVYSIVHYPPFWQVYDGLYSEQKLYVFVPPEIEDNYNIITRAVEAIREVVEAAFEDGSIIDIEVEVDRIVAAIMYKHFAGVSESASSGMAWYHGRLARLYDICDEEDVGYCRVGDVEVTWSRSYCNVGLGICYYYDYANPEEEAS